MMGCIVSEDVKMSKGKRKKITKMEEMKETPTTR
jgi:hypothetical protein